MLESKTINKKYKKLSSKELGTVLNLGSSYSLEKLNPQKTIGSLIGLSTGVVCSFSISVAYFLIFKNMINTLTRKPVDVDEIIAYRNIIFLSIPPFSMAAGVLRSRYNRKDKLKFVKSVTKDLIMDSLKFGAVLAVGFVVIPILKNLIF